jgi:CheY-like chemotaxis protein
MRDGASACHPRFVALRCLIVDDNREFLEAARDLLENGGLDVVGTAEGAADGVQRVLDLRPDVVLVDFHLGQESGFRVSRGLVQVMGIDAPPVIFISTYSEPDLVELVASTPAIGLLPKSELSAEAVMSMLEPEGNG